MFDMIQCPDCGYNQCHQRGDTTAYCPRCCFVFNHLSSFGSLVASLIKPV